MVEVSAHDNISMYYDNKGTNNPPNFYKALVAKICTDRIFPYNRNINVTVYYFDKKLITFINHHLFRD